MAKNLEQNIYHIQQKWTILKSLGRTRGLPHTVERLSEQLAEIEGGKKSNLNDVLNGTRPGSEALHEAILRVYGLDWPCPEYFDLEGRGRDKSVEEFRRCAFPPISFARFRAIAQSNRNIRFDDAFFSMQLRYAGHQQALSVEFDGRAIDCVDVDSSFGLTPVGTIRFKSLAISITHDSVGSVLFPMEQAVIERERGFQNTNGLRVRQRNSDFGYYWEVEAPNQIEDGDLVKGATPYMPYNAPSTGERLEVRVRSRFPYFAFNQKLVVEGETEKSDLETILVAHLKNKISRAPKGPHQRSETDDFDLFVQVYEPDSQEQI